MSNAQLKDTYTLYAVVAQLVSTVAKLAVAAASTNGSLRNAQPQDVAPLLDEVLGQLDSLLVLGTHISILAERTAAGSGAVHRLRAKHSLRDAPPDALEEVREFIAASRLQVRGGSDEEEFGPDTDRTDPVDAGVK